jgi:porin
LYSSAILGKQPLFAFKKAPLLLLALFVAFVVHPIQTRAQGSEEDVESFGGPTSVGETLNDDEPRRGYRFSGLGSGLDPYFDWKNTLREEKGLAFAFDYTSLYQEANESIGETDHAFGGIFRLYGSWSLYNNAKGDTGNLIYKVENRHRLANDIVPQALGSELGYVGLTGAQFGDSDGWILTNLHWMQRMKDGRFNLVGGVVDSTDYLNLYGMVDPLKAFSNLAFLTENTIPAPSQGLGAVMGWSPVERYYMVAGVYDANGDPGDPKDMFNTAFDESEFFKSLELGWFSSYEKRYLDKVNVTFWHVDEKEDAGVDDGWGVAASAAIFIKDKWMPFLRLGYSDGGGTLYDRSASAGIGRYFPGNNDLFGLGINWGRPAKDLFGSDIGDEYTAELFYRLQFSPNLSITPSLQLLIDPALNQEDDEVWVFGVRTRFVF